MKILFDECVPRRLRDNLRGHEVKTVPEAGWTGIKNGDLLKKAAGNFDVLITVDRNLSFQQNPLSLPIPVILIHSRSNKRKDLEPLLPAVRKLLSTTLSLGLHHIRA